MPLCLGCIENPHDNHENLDITAGTQNTEVQNFKIKFWHQGHTMKPIGEVIEKAVKVKEALIEDIIDHEHKLMAA